jgi:hypothetical protein
LLRGVFHFKFATILSVSISLGGLARAFARIPVHPANRAETATLGAASQAHRQGAQDALLRQIRHVEALPRKDVALAERIDITPVRRVKPLVDVNVYRSIDILEARVALAVDASVDCTLHSKHPVG